MYGVDDDDDDDDDLVVVVVVVVVVDNSMKIHISDYFCKTMLNNIPHVHQEQGSVVKESQC